MPELSWRDSATGRTVLLRRGLLAEAPTVLAEHGWEGFDLLTTERALADAPELGEAAARTHLVPSGPVPETAAAVIDAIGSERLVAFGGGRVIDSAKAIAAVRGGEVAAIPTTLSGAEMTGIHRMPEGHDGKAGVHPSLILVDPELITSAPEDELRASAMNALAHGADSMFTPLADELSTDASLKGAALIARSLDAGPDERDRSELALGAVLSAQALDRAGLALHHVLSQTTVRVCGTAHAQTNAALLPHTLAALRDRAPAVGGRLAEALGTPPEQLTERLVELARGPFRLGELGAEADCIEPVLDGATERQELFHMTPGEVSRDDLRKILEAAW
jgi:alcohol dehydrogenase class IV